MSVDRVAYPDQRQELSPSSPSKRRPGYKTFVEDTSRPHQFRNVFQRYRELDTMSVSFSDWLSESTQRVRRDGFRGVAESLYHVYVGSLLSVSTRVDIGTNVFEKDWDVLVVLDACRVDALRAVQDEYDFIDDVSSMWSVGSTTVEWMALTFRNEYRDEIGETAYVNGNVQFEKVLRDRRAPPHANAVPFGPSIDTYDVVDERDFGVLDTVYEYGYDDTMGVVPPRNITDRAINVWREESPSRQIVHYLQPHEPYIGVDDPPEHALRQLGTGDISRERVWDCYLDTLRLVLDDVELLLENFDAETVAITADHGEAMGEWGFHSHNIGCPHPVVRKVPWVTTSSVDEETYEPSLEPDTSVEPDTHAQLEDLGYL